MADTESRRGRAALWVAHCAGLMDLVALPLWVGALVAEYHLPPMRAGALVTLFLGSMVAASLAVAPRMQRLPARAVAAAGFTAGAIAFGAAAGVVDFAALAVLHAAGGLGVGSALSVTHGTMGRSAQPHRLFALAGMAVGLFGLAFVATMPRLIASRGGPVLFEVFAGVQAFAALSSWLLFPVPSQSRAEAAARGGRLPAVAWLAIAGVASMAMVQSMAFSFLERVGIDRGFGRDAVTAVLVALGLVNLAPGVLAALLEKRWSPLRVLPRAAVVQGALVATTVMSTHVEAYAMAGSLFVSVMIFAHAFAFGLMARIDRSGRAPAGTPAMLMTGAALGPVVAGALVQLAGYRSLGLAALALDALAAACFLALAVKTAAPIAEAEEVPA